MTCPKPHSQQVELGLRFSYFALAQDCYTIPAMKELWPLKKLRLFEEFEFEEFKFEEIKDELAECYSK